MFFQRLLPLLLFVHAVRKVVLQVFHFVVLQKDIFHILHGIIKGKWDRIVLHHLRRDSLIIKRAKLSWLESIYHYVHIHIMPLFPNTIRLKIKQFVAKMCKKDFVTKE